jgi:ABC-type thiamine transport system ATPase subunit
VQAHFRIQIILITHDPEDVTTLAQTLIVYDLGRVNRQVGIEELPLGGYDLKDCGQLAWEQ